MRRTLARVATAAGLSVAVLAPQVTTALAVAITPPTGRTGTLTQVGPIAEHGFPAWFRDSNNVRLEACTTLDDPLCPTLADEVPNPEAPVSYPDNFPGEFFYQLAGAEMTLNNGIDFGIGLDLEGAWAAEEVREGDQMVFGRVRIRFDAVEGTKYRITHPYGIDEIVADDRGVNMTEDIGTTPGAFGEAMRSRIGPFLKWDPAVAPAAPAGYTGNPGVDHRIVGSPYDTNFVRVEQLNPTSNNVIAQLGFTDLFSVQGRYARNSGVDINQATYTMNPSGTGGVVEVYASSESGQAIHVAANPALGFRSTPLRGDGTGRYYGRFPVSGTVPAGTAIEVVNAGDQPVTRKSRALVDVVRVTGAAYDSDAHTLTVAATSSDPAATFSVNGLGAINGTPFANVTAPPAAITVTSSRGGTAVAALTGSGNVFLPPAPVAGAFAMTPAIVGATVRLDGTGSTGEIDSYAWRRVSGPAATLVNANTATATFTPTAVGNYLFELTVTGPGGASTPMTVPVRVVAARAPVARAGANQTVIRGTAVTLDGTTSTVAETFSWRQVSGPAVTLLGATTAKPTFTFPLHALPAAPGPNRGFAWNNDPALFELTVTNPAGTSTVRTRVTPVTETISGVTARYRTRGEWRIDGTTDLLAGQRVTVVLGNLAGVVLGTTAVDATGAFSLRVATPAPGNQTVVALVTSAGGRLGGIPITVTG